MTIRAFHKNDSPALIDIFRQNSPAYFSPQEEQDFITYLEKETEDYFVVEIDQAVVAAGGINYQDEDRLAFISWDLVLPSYQGQGIGRKLLEHRLAWIKRKRPTYKIIVRTSQFTEKFYEKCGFVIKERADNFWAPGYDLVSMEFQG